MGSLRSPRAAHSATAIAGGKVLIAGGMAEEGAALRAFEIYEAATNRTVAAGEMQDSRAGHTATILPEGHVLLIGGYNGTYLKTAEIFDTGSGKFTIAGSMVHGRSGHTATLLADGTVLVAGGVGDGWSFLPSAEVYDPSTHRFAPAAPLVIARESHTATLLANGEVLVIGGHRGRREKIEIHRSTEIYDPGRRLFRPGPLLTRPRHKHEALSLTDGRVLVLGGSDRRDVPDGSTEIFDPKTGRFAAAAPMARPRHKVRDTAVRLSDGSILVAGGARFAELLDPLQASFRQVEGDFGADHWFASATLLTDGDVLVVGGYTDGVRKTEKVWRFHR